MPYQSMKGNPINKTWFDVTNLGFLGSIIIIVLSACNSLPSNIVSRVGNEVITSRDIAYRRAVQEIRTGEEFPDYLALYQLLEEALMAEVAREYEVVVTEEMMLQEAARVEEETRDPDTLAEIQEVFGNDQEAYRRLVLKPNLVNQLLHARFSLGHDIQAEPLSRAKEVLTAAKRDTDSIPELASEYEGQYRKITIVNGQLIYEGQGHENSEVELPPELTQYDDKSSGYGQAFIRQVVTGLKEGEVHPNVVEDSHTFMVVGLLSRERNDARLESVVIPKLAFDPWFKSRVEKVEIQIYDQGLLDKLINNVDETYLTQRIKEEKLIVQPIAP